jgi:hypothetical protein
VKCRLLQNLIIGGKHFSRGIVLDDSKIPENLREYCSYEDLEGKEGRVLLLEGITYNTEQIDPVTKQRTGYPITLARGELVRLDEIPLRQRTDWVDGREYKSDWVEADRVQLRQEETQEYMKQFQPEPRFDFYDV